jgi:hypothetical protein
LKFPLAALPPDVRRGFAPPESKIKKRALPVVWPLAQDPNSYEATVNSIRARRGGTSAVEGDRATREAGAKAARIRYQEVVDVTHAQRTNYQGNYKFTLEARRGQFAYVTIAHGHDPQYLDSYSVKQVDPKEKEID